MVCVCVNVWCESVCLYLCAGTCRSQRSALGAVPQTLSTFVFLKTKPLTGLELAKGWPALQAPGSHLSLSLQH